MINRAELTEIGYIAKTHGVSGELKFIVSVDLDWDDLSCIVMDVDGIYVPFFPTSIRNVGVDGYLIELDGIESEDAASEFIGKKIYALSSEIPDDNCDDDGLYAEDLIGFKVSSDDGMLEGEIVDVDTTTDNTLLIILTVDGRRVMVPLADEFISILNPDNRTLELELPDGLLNLD